MPKSFALVPLHHWTLLGLWLPMLSLMAVTVGVMTLQPPASWPGAVLFAPLLILLTTLIVQGLLHRRRLHVSAGQLDITIGPFHQQIAVAHIDLAQARLRDLDEHTELKPHAKTRGFNLPAFYGGHYRLRNRAKAFCLITDSTRVLDLPLQDGSHVLVSPEKPHALLAYLRKVADTTPAR